MVWWTTNVLEGIILTRGVFTGLTRRFQFFYYYLFYVLIESLLRFGIFIVRPHLYPYFYWYSQLASAVIGYAVIWGLWIFTLAGYPGAARVSYWLLPAIFSLIVVWGALRHTQAAVPVHGLLVEYERNIRGAQALFLFVLVLVILYYRIPVSRNLRGMLTGFAVYVSASTTGLAMHAFGIGGDAESWKLVQPVAYLVSLVVWCIFLWSPAPATSLELSSEFDNYYLEVTNAVNSITIRLRDYLTRAMKS